MVNTAIGGFYPRLRKRDGSPPALIIDISGSMHEHLTPSVRSEIEAQAFAAQVPIVALADIDIVKHLTVSDIVRFSVADLPSRGTGLVAPVETLLEGYGSVLVVTDDDGDAQLRAAYSVEAVAEWGEVKFLDVSLKS